MTTTVAVRPAAGKASPMALATGPLEPRAAIASIFTILAIGFGGGGSSAPLSELAVQVAAVIAAIAWLLTARDCPQASRGDRLVAGIAALVLVLPVVQLLPLPPALWKSLPGREIEAASLGVVGAAQAWMPWSMAPSRTLASLVAMLPAVLALAMAASLDVRQRDWVLRAVVLAVALSVVLGALQLSAGASGGWRPYGADNSGYLNGFQANRNAQADILLIGIAALAAVAVAARGRIGRRLAAAAAITGIAVMVLACVLTGSRTGIFLVPVALIFAVLIWRPRIASRRSLGVAAAVVAAGLATTLFLLRDNTAIGRVLDRFGSERDFRFELWDDTRFAIAAHWPFGSGIGTFRPIFIAVERLEVVDPTMPVRAHNDFLEFVLETGMFGLIVLLACAALLGVAAVRAWRNRSVPTRPQVLFSASVMVTIGLHSFVDYPLRSMALAHLTAIAAGILIACARERTTRVEMETPQS